MNGNFSRRDFLRQAGMGTLGLAICGFAQEPSKPKTKTPNLVIVFPDQMRAQAMGFMNEDPVITPNLDKFAKQSLVLREAVSNLPICSPFRSMFMTGQVPHKTGIKWNCTNIAKEHGAELPKDTRCWSDVLKDKGYSLGYIGKWHLDAPHEPFIDCKNNHWGKKKWNEWCTPDRRHGFDFWYAYGTYDEHMKPLYWSKDAKRNEFHYVDQWGPEHEADMAIKYLRNENHAMRDSDKPFALVVSMNPPHTPFDEFPKKYLEHYQDKTYRDLVNRENVDLSKDSPGHRMVKKHLKNYLAMVTGIDEQFGRILNELKKLDLEEDTIVLFTSDHGSCVGCHDWLHKNLWWEESMRIPFIIRWPGKIPLRKDDLLLSVPDIYPTLLDLMGFKNDIGRDIDGISHADIFLGKKGYRPKSQWYSFVEQYLSDKGPRGVRTDRWTYVIVSCSDKSPNFGFSSKNAEYLFDRKNDKYQL